MGFKDTFKRKEKKFLLTRSQFDELMGIIEAYLEPDEYHHSDIHSIYYDTDDYDIINRSLEKSAYKEKLRVRDYGGEDVFVELKKKYKGIVYKRRILVPRAVATSWLDNGVPFAEAMRAASIDRKLTYMEKQVSGEVDAFMRRYQGKLTPSMDIHADRYSFREKGTDNPIRITFDTGIWYEDLRSDDAGEKSLTEYIVMETKVADAYPLWLAKALSQLRLFPTSFSKYGTAYKMVRAATKTKEKPAEISIVREPATGSMPAARNIPAIKQQLKLRQKKNPTMRRLVNA